MIMSSFFDSLRVVSSGVIPECRIHIQRSEPEAYAIQLCRSGEMYFQVDEHPELIIKGPSIFWTSPNYFYRYGPGPNTFWDHCWILFKGSNAESYFENGLKNVSRHGFTTIHNLIKCEQFFETLHLLSGSLSPQASARGNITLQQLLFFMQEEAINPHQSNTPEERLRSFANEIKQRPERTYNLPSEAQKLGMSYSHFRRRFKNIFNITPHQFIINSRMTIAARYLEDHNLQIQEIGERIGYPDPAQFSTAFKNMIGRSPRDYRIFISRNN